MCDGGVPVVDDGCDDVRYFNFNAIITTTILATVM